MKKGLLLLAILVSSFGAFAQLTVTLGVQKYCFQQSNGKVWANVSGGTAPYTYQWNSGNPTSPLGDTIYNLHGSTVSVTVTDNLGQTKVASTILTGFPSHSKSKYRYTSDPTICPNDQISLQLSYTTFSAEPYYLSWSNGVLDTITQNPSNNRSSKITVQAPTSASVTITDNNGCQYVDTFNNVLPSSTFNVYVDEYIYDCQSPYCLRAYPNDSFPDPYNDPQGPFTYEWSTGYPEDTFALNCNIWSNSFFNVTVTNGGGCTGTLSSLYATGDISGIAVTQIVDTPTCTKLGSVTLDITGGTPPYTVDWWADSNQWDYLGTGPTLNNLVAGPGPYYVGISDAEFCQVFMYINIPYNNDVSAMIPTVDSTLDHCAGTACLELVYDNLPAGNFIAEQNWTDISGSFWDTARAICVPSAGQYIYQIYGNNWYFCSYTDTILLSFNPQLTVTASSTPASCGNDGSVSCTATNGLPPYTYLWNTSATTATVSNLPAGNYTVTVTDANSCSDTVSVVIASGQMTLDSVSTTKATCATAATGGAYVSISSASPPISYLWSNSATTNNISNVLPGTYTVTATDANGCSMVQTVNIATTGLQLQTIALSNVDCSGTAGGILQVTPLNGTTPFTYSWSNGSTVDTASNLAEDFYRVTVTDNFGCTAASGKSITMDPVCTSLLTGRVYADTDLNCSYSTSDVGISNKVVVIEPGFSALTDSQGRWQAIVPINTTYKTYISNIGTLVSGTCGFDTVTVSPIDTLPIPNIDFPKQTGLINDIQVQLNCGVVRPGFVNTITINIVNNGLIAASGTGTFVLSTVLDSIQQVSPSAFVTIDSISTSSPRTVYYSYNNLPAQNNGTITITVVVPTIPFVALGQQVTNTATVSLLNYTDQNITNNTFTCNGTIIGSYDPNDKQVFSQTGESIDGPTSVDDTLMRYLVRFQNTGTDTAFNILVRDTLHANLNIHTFQLVATSHPVEVQFRQDSIIHFIYNNILLPDSNVNEPKSHGFVEFTVELRNPGVLDELTNQAAIYFDYNPPIYTNTVATQRNYYPCLYPASTYETVTNQTICHGGAYWGYTSSGTYRDTFTVSAGCDSISVLDLTVLPLNLVNLTQTICSGQSFEGYSATGVYADTFSAANGCDSIRVLNLTVGNSILTVLNETVCFGDSYLGYSASGTYYDTLTASSGCDSVRQLNLTVNAFTGSTVDAAICDGQSYYAGGSNQTVAGTYTDTLTASSGCDSIVTTNLIVNALPAIPAIQQNGNLLTIDATGITSFEWYLDGNIINSAINDSLTATANGAYYVVVYDANNCSSTSSTVQVTGVSIEDAALLPVFVFPNPTTGKIYITLGGRMVEQLELYSVLGKKLEVPTLNNGTPQAELDASELASGVYMLRIYSGGHWYQERVVVSK